MPVVPFVQAAPQQGFQLPGPPPDDQWTLMAAAQMHSEGRLIEPEAQIQQAQHQESITKDRVYDSGWDHQDEGRLRGNYTGPVMINRENRKEIETYRPERKHGSTYDLLFTMYDKYRNKLNQGDIIKIPKGSAEDLDEDAYMMYMEGDRDQPFQPVKPRKSAPTS